MFQRKSPRTQSASSANTGSIKRTRGDRFITKAQMDRQIKGDRFRPSLTPPIFSSNPWCTIIARVMLSLQSAVPHLFNSDGLGKQILNQFGISGNIEFRVQSYSCWAFASPNLQLWPLDFVTGSSHEMTVCDSMAQKNMYACVGYEYPLSHKAKVFSTVDAKATNLLTVLTSTTGQVEVHIKCLFRGGDPKYTTLDFVQKPIQVVVNEFEEVREDANTIRKDLLRTMGKLDTSNIAQAKVQVRLALRKLTKLDTRLRKDENTFRKEDEEDDIESDLEVIDELGNLSLSNT